MASWSIKEVVPNVLIVTGDDIVSGRIPDEAYKGKLIEYLNEATDCPVHRGTHDFWVVYTTSRDIAAVAHCCADPALTPRPYRGFVHMELHNLDDAAMVDNLNTLTQEICHYWLVPSDLMFNIDGRSVAPLTGSQFTDAINNGRSLPAPALLGRDKTHWSCYWQSGRSPMDGISFSKIGEQDGYTIFSESAYEGYSIEPEGLPPVVLNYSLNDLDLWLMNIKDSGSAYWNRGNRIEWFDPQLIAPLGYSAGIYLAFSRNDHIQFGFHQDHRTLAIQRTGHEPYRIALDEFYRPLQDDLNGVSLRIVKRGNRYFFQAKYDNPFGGCLMTILRALDRATRGRVRGVFDIGLFDGVDSPGEPPNRFNFHSWQTVYAMDSNDSPITGGQYIRKWNDFGHTVDYLYCEAAFFDLALKTPDRENRFYFTEVPSPWPDPGNYADLDENMVVLEQPTDGAIIRSPFGRLHMALPYALVSPDGLVGWPDGESHFKHDETTDNCPKTVLKLPSGDFAIATSAAKIVRTAITPWAGGGANGKTYWVKLNTLTTNQIVIPERYSSEVWPSHPTDGKFKVAFILVGSDESSITDDLLQKVDKIRSYFDKAFFELTERNFSLDSNLVGD